MNWQNMWRLAKSDYFKLVPILALAFYVAFIPHQNYPYPVHLDEWVHLAYSKALLTTGSAISVNPFFGQAIEGLHPHLEAGFHLFWGVFHQISGLSWLTIFRYFPSVMFMITVLSVYALAHREGFGLEAALFTCLILTTVGILGPAFLVPVAMALPFIPLTLFVVFNFRNAWAYLVVFVFTSFLLSIHAPSAICLVIVLGPYIIINLKSNFKHSMGITLAVIVPFLALFPWIFSLLLPTAKSLLTPTPLSWYIDFPRIIETYGYPTFLLCLLGTLKLALRGDRKGYGLTLGLLALALMLAIFFALHYGVSIVYERGLTFMMLMMSIMAGAGLMWVKEIRLPERIGIQLKVPFITQHIGKVLCLALIVFTLVMSIPARQSIPYYHMIDKQDYEAFVWIRDNVSGDYEKAILDPWKATAFVAITGKWVFSRIHAYPKPTDLEAYEYLESGCVDTTFLRENGISVVYSRGECDNPDLLQVREYVYLLKEGEIK